MSPTPSYSVKFTREACHALQRLQRHEQRRIRDVFPLLDRDGRNTLTGAGPRKWRRRRLGSLRVIWAWDEQNRTILILRAGHRDGDFYERIPDDLSATRDDDPDAKDTAGAAEAEKITYDATPCVANDEAWYGFVYGGYRYRPDLSEEQEEFFGTLGKGVWENTPYSGSAVQILQSGPGTGKTVCAAEMAFRAFEHFKSVGKVCYVALLVPPELAVDLLQFPRVRELRRQADTHDPNPFFLGDFVSWVRSLDPNSAGRLVPEKLELQALERLARPEKIDPLDLMLYRAILGRDEPKDLSLSPHRERIDRLREMVPTERFLAKLREIAGKEGATETWASKPLARHELSEHLTRNPPAPPKGGQAAFLILDEAQDLYNADHKAMKTICESWRRRSGLPVGLLVLGDKNQRIVPNGSTWTDYEVHPRSLQRNYRNSQPILELANRVLALSRSLGSEFRHPERASSPANPGEKAEPVRLLRCPTAREADEFLRLMDSKRAIEEERELLRRLSQKTKVLARREFQGYQNLQCLLPKSAKGREFASCVGYRLFEGRGEPTWDDITQWYTLITRTQSRLLLVATDEEYERMWGLFRECEEREWTRAEECIAWVLELNSEADLSDDSESHKRELLRAFAEGKPYYDTCEVADHLGLDRTGFERDALEALARGAAKLDCDEGRLQDRPSLRCLLLRAGGRSWEAARFASKAWEQDPSERRRVIRAIADDLERGSGLPMRLPFEASRVRAAFLGEPLDAMGLALEHLIDPEVYLPAHLLGQLENVLRTE